MSALQDADTTRISVTAYIPSQTIADRLKISISSHQSNESGAISKKAIVVNSSRDKHGREHASTSKFASSFIQQGLPDSQKACTTSADRTELNSAICFNHIYWTGPTSSKTIVQQDRYCGYSYEPCVLDLCDMCHHSEINTLLETRFRYSNRGDWIPSWNYEFVHSNSLTNHPSRTGNQVWSGQAAELRRYYDRQVLVPSHKCRLEDCSSFYASASSGAWCCL